MLVPESAHVLRICFFGDTVFFFAGVNIWRGITANEVKKWKEFKAKSVVSMCVAAYPTVDPRMCRLQCKNMTADMLHADAKSYNRMEREFVPTPCVDNVCIRGTLVPAVQRNGIVHEQEFASCIFPAASWDCHVWTFDGCDYGIF